LKIFAFAKKASGKGDDTILETILRGGLTSFGVRCTGLVLGLVSHIFLSRLLGPSEYGLYAVALGWTMILVVPAKFGLDHTALRYASVYIVENRIGLLKSLVLYSARFLFFSSALIGFVVIVVGWQAPHLLGLSRTGNVVWLVLLIELLAFLGVFSAYFRAAQKIFSSQFYEQVLRSSILIILLVVSILIGHKLSFGSALMITTLAALGALVALLFQFWLVFFREQEVSVEDSRSSEWLHLSWPIFVIAVAQQIMNQVNVIFLGWFSESETAGLFSVAARLAAFVPFGLVALNSITAPMIATTYSQNNIDELRRIVSINARISLMFALGVSMIFILGGKHILLLFGNDFIAAYPALLILLLGGLVNAGTGSVGYMMTMTNRQRVSMLLISGSLVINIGLSFVLILNYGLLGGSIAAAIGVILVNLSQYIYVWMNLGIDTSPLGLNARKSR